MDSDSGSSTSSEIEFLGSYPGTEKPEENGLNKILTLLPDTNWNDYGLDHVLKLIPPKVTLGRAASNDIIMACSSHLKSLEFSRSHCEFEQVKGTNKWRVKNLSVNGLRVNEKRVKPGESRELKIGDIIALLIVGGPKYEFGEETAEQDMADDCIIVDESEEYFDCTENSTSDLSDLKQKLSLAKIKLSVLEIENESLEEHIASRSQGEQEQIEQKRQNLSVALKELDSVKKNTFELIMDTISDSFKCVICDKLPIQPQILNCGHTFCSYCITQHQKDQAKRFCPKCKHEISCTLNHVCLRNFVSQSLDLLPEEYHDVRKVEISEREKETTAATEKTKTGVKTAVGRKKRK